MIIQFTKADGAPQAVAEHQKWLADPHTRLVLESAEQKSRAYLMAGGQMRPEFALGWAAGRQALIDEIKDLSRPDVLDAAEEFDAPPTGDEE